MAETLVRPVAPAATGQEWLQGLFAQHDRAGHTERQALLEAHIDTRVCISKWNTYYLYCVAVAVVDVIVSVVFVFVLLLLLLLLDIVWKVEIRCGKKWKLGRVMLKSKLWSF